MPPDSAARRLLASAAWRSRARPGPTPRRGRCRRGAGPVLPRPGRTPRGTPGRSRHGPDRDVDRGAPPRSGLGVLLEGAHLDRTLAGHSRLGGPRQRVVEAVALDDPEAADV